MHLVPDASLDDGLLDVVLCRDASKRSFLAGLPKVFKGTHVDDPNLTFLRGREIAFHADRPFAAYADGDPIADLPVTIRVVPRCLEGARPVTLLGPKVAAAKAVGTRRPRRGPRRRHVAAGQGADAPGAARDRDAGAAARARQRGDQRDERQDHHGGDDRGDPRAHRRAARAQPRRRQHGGRRRLRAGRGRAPRRPRAGRRARAVRGRRVLARAGRAGARAARAAARQPVPRPARPLRGARDDRRALGRRRGRARGSRRARAERRRPAGRRPRPRARRRSTSASRTTRSRIAELQHAADSKHCRRCGHPYAYEAIYLAHLGRYACPNCGAAPARAGRGGARGGAARHPLGGVHARHARRQRARRAAAARALQRLQRARRRGARAWPWARRWTRSPRGLRAVAPAFGRAETLELGGRPTSILLVKNPAGANEVLRTLALEGEQLDVFGVLNDHTADGRDVSWVWDADWELLAPSLRHMTCSGTRAAELALRLKYAGVPAERLTVVPDLTGRTGRRPGERRRAAVRAADLHRAARAARPARRAAARSRGTGDERRDVLAARRLARRRVRRLQGRPAALARARARRGRAGARRRRRHRARRARPRPRGPLGDRARPRARAARRAASRALPARSSRPWSPTPRRSRCTAASGS